MSKISELPPITGANTRSEDLFVIVNLVQGDDGTSNITRKELVQAIQYEIFDRITITGGTISGVVMSDSRLDNVIIDNSNMEDSEIIRTLFDDGQLTNSTGDNLEIVRSDFSDGTGANNTFTDSRLNDSTANNVAITSSTFTDGEIFDSTGNNVVLTSSELNDSTANNVVITNSEFNEGTGNNVVLTNSTIDDSTITDSTANNVAITSSTFTDGAVNDSTANNVTMTNSSFTDGTIADSTANNVGITSSTFADGAVSNSTANNITITASTFDNGALTNSTGDNVDLVNSDFSDGTGANNVFTGSELNDSTANNLAITSSDFSDGTGNNNVFTNTTIDQGVIQDSVIVDSSFTGTMANVVAENMTITSSTATGFGQTKSTFDDGDVTKSTFKDGVIDQSKLVDFDMEIENDFEPSIDENSWFALKNEKTGETEKITYGQFFREISKTTATDLKVHVDPVKGDDSNPGTMLEPIQTLERASELAIEKAGGDANRNAINNAIHISCGPGTYYTKGNIALPDDCAMTSTAGQYATVIEALPGYENNNAVLVGSGCYVQGFAYQNWKVDNFDFPEGGFAVAYRPGAKLLRSPYIRDSSQLSNFLREDVEPPLQPFNTKGNVLDLGREFILEVGYTGQFLMDDEITFSSGAKGYISWDDTRDLDPSGDGSLPALTPDLATNRKIFVRNLKNGRGYAVGDTVRSESGGVGVIESIGIDNFPNPLVGRGGGCMLADRRVLDPDSLYTYVLCFGFTPRSQNGIGYVARDGAGVNGIGSLSIFVRVAFYALNGGQMTLNNSGTQFGDISMRAKGTTEIFAPKDPDPNGDNLFGNTVFASVLTDNSDLIIEDMIGHLTANTSDGGLGYTGYDADKCERDSKIIIDNSAYDITLDTNYWGRLAGISYRSPISSKVVGEQLEATLGANQYLQSRIESLFDGDVIDRANTSFQELYNVVEFGEENMNPIIFTDTGNAKYTSAREVLQDNRSFIQDELLDWIDNNDEFFAYDSVKCKRDTTEYILPAAKYDMLLDTNYNAVRAGGAYFMKSAEKVVGQQRNETVAAYRRLKDQTNALIDGDSYIATSRVDAAMDEIVDILDYRGTTYTPTNATYDPTTGIMVVTIGAHSLTPGRKVLVSEGGITFSCGTDGNVINISHPRPTDPVFKSPIEILDVTATTITTNVGRSFYTGIHTFVSALPNSVIEMGSEITWSDDTNIPVDNRNARKQIQANREFIQDQTLGYIDDNYFRYDSEKCSRDVLEYILPAVERDLITGSNFNSIQTGVAYRQGTQGAETVVRDQLVETVGAMTHLKGLVSAAATDAPSRHRTDAAFDQIIDILNNNGKSYTPGAGTTYDPTTGVLDLAIGAHDLQEGATVLLDDESIVFTCALDGNTTNHAYPRKGDPAYRTPVTINTVTATSITVNVGGYLNGTAHTWVSSTTDCVKSGTYEGSYTPSTATYDPATGIFEATIGQHNLSAGDYIEIKPNSVVFTCDLDGDVTEHAAPQAHHPYYRKPVKLTAVTATTITCNIGAGTGGTHTFAYAHVGAIDGDPVVWTDPSRYLSYYTPTTATYDPVTGESVVTIPGHDIALGDYIEFAPYSFTFTCSQDSDATEHSYPRKGDGNYNEPMLVTAVAGDDITVNSGVGAGGTHTFVSATNQAVAKTTHLSQGQLAREQLQANRSFLQNEVMAYLDTQYFVFDGDKCSRDTGIILNSVRHDILTGSNFSSVFAGLAYRAGTTSGDMVISDQLTQTVAAIEFVRDETANYLSGTALARSTSAFNEIVDVLQNGQANADPIVFGTAGLSTAHVEAQQALQANKAFLQAEITSWLAANYPALTYDVAKCERDLGYIIDSASFDVQFGGNTASINNARLYYSNAVAVLPEDQRVPTARAFEHIAKVADQIVRGEDVVPTFGSQYSPTNATYDPATGVYEAIIGTHGLNIGDFVWLADNGVTFECDMGSGPANHTSPQSHHPYWRAPVEITAVTATSITMNVGTGGTGQTPHTFVSAVPNAISEITGNTTAQDNTYPSGTATDAETFTVGKDVVDAISLVATMIQEANFDSLPEIQQVTYRPGDATLVSAYNDIDGVTESLQGAVIKYLREEHKGLPYNKDKCYRDVGLITDAISKDIEYGGNQNTIEAAKYYFAVDLEEGSTYEQLRVVNVLPIPVTGQFAVLDDLASVSGLREATNVLPLEQREPTKLAFEHLASVAEKVVTETAHTSLFPRYTPTNATYDPATGIYTAEIGAHSLTVGKEVWLKPNGVTFSCDMGSGVANHTSPQAHHPYYNAPVKIESVTSTSITMNVGTGGSGQQAHTFVSADADSISEGPYQITDGTATTAATGTAVSNLYTIISDVVEDNDLDNLDTVEVKPLADPNRTVARKQIQRNKDFIVEEVVAYLNDEYYTFPGDKCKRDVGLIIDAVKRDVLTGSNFNAVFNGLAYRIGTPGADAVINEQLTETISAIEYARDIAVAAVTDVTAKTRTTDAFNEVIDIMGNGSGNADNINYGSEWVSIVHLNARLQLQNNKEFLQAEITAWLAQNRGSLTYDVAKCERDLGYILDSVSFDIQHGGNTASRNNAILYFENAVSVLPEDQREPTAAAFNHIANVAELVVQETPVTPTPGNGVSQNFNSGNASPAVAAKVKDLINIITEAVGENGLEGIPVAIENTQSTYDVVYQAAYAAIEGTKEAIQDGVLSHLSVYFNTLSYNEVKCRRDLSFIIDAVTHDIQYGGNASTVNASGLYFENAVSVLPLNQRQATRDAFLHLGKVMNHVTREIVVEPTVGNPYTQSFKEVAANPLTGHAVQALVEIVANTVDDAIPSTANIPAAVAPNLEWVAGNYKASNDLIEDSAKTMADSVISYISTTYNGLSFPEFKCRRDIGYLIDAVSHDVQYGGNFATRQAAGIYFENGISVLPVDTRIQTADVYAYLATLLDGVVQETDVSSATTYTPTDATYDPATGVFTATIGSNSFNVGDKVWFKLNGITFSCDMGSGVANHTSPQSHHPYSNRGCPITAVDGNVITMNVGTGGTGQVPHTFVSAVADSISTGPYQDTDGDPATAVEGARAAELIGYIEDAIRQDTIESLPPHEEPDTSWVASDLTDAAVKIDSNRYELANDLVEFLRREFDVLDYNRAKCRRDTGYLLDAFSYDLNYGGNTASRWNADFYFWNSTYRIPEDQRIPTAKSYRQLGQICKDIVLGHYPGQVVKSGTGTEVESAKVEGLANIFYETQINNDTKYLPVKIEPDYDWVSSDVADVQQILEFNKIDLAADTVRFVNATYRYVDLNLTRRDGKNLLKAIKSDFESLNAGGPSLTGYYQNNGSSVRTRAYVAAFFDYDGTHVFPVFNPARAGLKYKGSVVDVAALAGITGQKPYHAYIVATDLATSFYEGNIYYWNPDINDWTLDGANNTDLLDAFVGAWDRMKDYIVANLSPDAEHTVMINQLFNDCIKDNVLRPETLTFGSLVESIAHQFNGASAGVNRNALPLNFRNLGLPISALASVLSEDGGRIRWSGADELNNQYFARGLRINGRTGRIEGRPFTSSVRKLARRASNSRASI